MWNPGAGSKLDANEEFRHLSGLTVALEAPVPDSVRARLRAMGHETVDVDTLCARTGRKASEVVADLLRLEIAGSVASLPGGLYQRLNG